MEPLRSLLLVCSSVSPIKALTHSESSDEGCRNRTLNLNELVQMLKTQVQFIYIYICPFDIEGFTV